MATRTTTDPIEILLEMGVDLDNLSEEEDYLSALMEAVNTLTIVNSKDSRISALQKEIVKVRNKRKASDPKFNVRKTKISASKIKSPKSLQAKKQKIPVQKLLPSSATVRQGSEVAGEESKKKRKGKTVEVPVTFITSVNSSVKSILKTLKKQSKFVQKQTEKDRKEAEKTKRGIAETKLEKTFFKPIIGAAEKIIAPVKGILGKIFDFLFNVFLAKVVMKVFNWMADPENKSKLENTIRFLIDFGPKLLGAYLLFGTRLGRFVTRIATSLIFGAARLSAAAFKMIAALPWWAKVGLAGTALFGAGAAVPTLFPDTVKDAADEQADALKREKGAEAAADAIERQNSDRNLFQKAGDFITGAGAERQEQVERLRTGEEQRYFGGGLVQGFNGGGHAFNLLNPLSWFGGSSQKAVKDNKTRYNPNSLSGKLLNRRNATNEAIQKMRGYEEGGEVDGPGGIDKVPAMLTDGEFVMSRGAVQKYGVGQLEAMNAAGGGTNKPKIMNNMVYADGGGGIGPSFAEHSSDFMNSFTNRFVMGDDSLLNRLAYGDIAGALKTLGIKIDRNTEATNRNTTQRKENNNILKDALGMSEDFAKDIIGDAQNIAPTAKSFIENIASMGGGFVGGLKDKRKEISEFIENTPYFGETAAIERERKLGLMKPGADSLLPEVRERLKSNDERIRNLYDPEKDTGFMGGLKKMNQNIQNKGFFHDPFAALGLKEEETEKFVEKITSGRVKNLGAKITGLQFAAKGLAGPLGRMFQIDDRGSLGRYLRPAMEEAQRQGHGAVGAKALGQKKYDELVPDRLANLALGQTAFTVNEDGRAKTSDTYDSNNTAEYYFKTSREALSKGNIGPALFNGLSGLLRVNQNTGWGNLRPGGNDIDLGGGFTPTDSSGKVKKVSKMSAAQLMNAQAYAESKGKYFSSTTGKTYASYSDAIKDPAIKAKLGSNKPNVSIPAAPQRPAPKVVVTNVQDQSAASNPGSGSGSDVPVINASNGSQSNAKILGFLPGPLQLF